MKKQIFLTLSFFFFFQQVGNASDRLEAGENIFNNNCNVCHIGGNNIINKEKNLRKKSLETNGMDNIEAIIYQVTNGKNGMPAFGGRLSEQEIEKVARYVLDEFGKIVEN